MPVWGQSRAQVKAAFGDAEPWTDNVLELVYVTEGIGGYPVKAYFYFLEDQLGAVTYYLDLSVSDTEKIHAAYEDVKDLLVIKYGKPKYDFEPGAAELYSGEFAGADHAYKHALWYLDGTKIRLNVMEKYIVAPYIELSYTRGEFFPFEEPEAAPFPAN